MVFVIALAVKIMKIAKHGSVLHIVPVNDTVGIRKIPGVGAVHKQGTPGAFLAVWQPVHIVLVVVRLYHGIIDAGAGAVEPRTDIGRAAPQL